jgi:DNA-binding LytR/AlgR family response regulator
MSKKPLRTLIVDDEPIARRLLAEELAEMEAATVIGEAENGEEALRQIEDLRPDLVLLDIQMPVMDGFEVIRRLRGPLPAIVFVTAFSEHALRAFEIGAVDYLLKPISVERLRTALERVREARTNRVENAERVARVLDAADSRRRPRVVARHGRDLYLLDLDEVFAFQAEGEIVWIIGVNKKFTATQSLQAIHKKLEGTEFQRVHRGAIVNTNKIRKMSALSSQRWLLTLTNGLQFTVSKRQAPMLRDILR